MPTLTIYAGVNGAGKTSLYGTIKDSTPQQTRVNIDEIMQELNMDNNSTDSLIKAGKVALHIINDCLATDVSFNWETTMITSTHLKMMKKAKEMGYNVNLLFVGVKDINTALTRIENRVKNGGHNVPQKDVEYRFKNQFKNITQCLKFVDKALFFDNTTKCKLVASYAQDKFAYLDFNCPWVSDLLETLQPDNNLNK